MECGFTLNGFTVNGSLLVLPVLLALSERSADPELAEGSEDEGSEVERLPPCQSGGNGFDKLTTRPPHSKAEAFRLFQADQLFELGFVHDGDAE